FSPARMNSSFYLFDLLAKNIRSDLQRQSIKHRREVGLHIARANLDYAIIAFDQPSAFLYPPRGGRRAFFAWHEIDHQPERERDEITDVLAARGLPFEPTPGKAAVGGERGPQCPLGLGWIAAQKARQAAHRAALFRNAAAAMLGQKR